MMDIRHRRWLWTSLLMAAVATGKQAQMVAPSPSEAYFKVYTDQALETERYDPIGGTVYPVVYVRLGAANRVAPEAAELTVTVQDMHAVHIDPQTGQRDPATLAELDTVDLAAATGWQRKSGETWVDSCGPAAYDNQYGQDKVLFRYKLNGTAGWDTESVPLGHNGEHRLTADAAVGFQAFDNAQWGEAEECGPAAKTAVVQNLVITKILTNAGNSDYLFFDPDSDQEDRTNPTVTVRFEDCVGGPWQVNALIRDTRNGNPWDDSATITLEVEDPGEYQLQYDSADPDKGETDGTLEDAHTYAVDVDIVDTSSSDLVSHKEPYHLQVGEHDVRFEDEEILADYQLHDYAQTPKDAQAVAIDFVVDDFEVVRRKTGAPTAIGTAHEGVTLGSEPLDYYKWIAVWTGEDDHAATQRDHSSQRMVPFNQSGYDRVMNVEHDHVVAAEGSRTTDMPVNIPLVLSTFDNSDIELGEADYNAGNPIPRSHRTGWRLNFVPPAVPYEWRDALPSTSGSTFHGHDAEVRDFSYAHFEAFASLRSHGPAKSHCHYVHLVLCHWFNIGDTATQGRSDPRDRRHSFIFCAAIDTAWQGWANDMHLADWWDDSQYRRTVWSVTSHELGHQLLDDSQNLGHADPGSTAPDQIRAHHNPYADLWENLAENRAEEARSGGSALTEWERILLSAYRGRLRPGCDGIQDDHYLRCTMHNCHPKDRVFRFCPYHARIMVYGPLGWNPH